MHQWNKSPDSQSGCQDSFDEWTARSEDTVASSADVIWAQLEAVGVHFWQWMNLLCFVNHNWGTAPLITLLVQVFLLWLTYFSTSCHSSRLFPLHVSHSLTQVLMLIRVHRFWCCPPLSLLTLPTAWRFAANCPGFFHPFILFWQPYLFICGV